MPCESTRTTAFILAGGLGTRLSTVVSDRPKPMALVHGTPFLEILMDSLVSKGVRSFVLLTGYRAEMIEQYFRQWKSPTVTVRFSQEPEPLGTGGAVRHAAEFATDPTLLINGDTFYDADLRKLLRFHQKKKATVSLSLMPVPDAGRYGSVELDAEGRVIGFYEKLTTRNIEETMPRTRDSLSLPGLINAGFSLLSHDFIQALPENKEFSMEREVFPALCRSGRVFGLPLECSFFDIGTPESYEAFQQFVGRNRR